MRRVIFGGVPDEPASIRSESNAERRQAYEDEHGWGSSDEPITILLSDNTVCECGNLAKATAWCEDSDDSQRATLCCLCLGCLSEMNRQDRIIKVIELRN
jgi:hypothetical protein